MTYTPNTVAIPAPTRRRRIGFEQAAWLFMRLSGVLLVVLIAVHLTVNLMLGDGISAIDFGFVANKWASPVWQVFDMVMLWLAMLHGTNGLRVVIGDYASNPKTRFWLQVALYAATILIVTVGTLTIFTFDPCLDPHSTLSVCAK